MVLEFDGVQKAFADSEGMTPVLQGVSFALAAGQTLALTGESGSGKSTVLNIASGLDRPDAGRVRVAGQDLSVMDDSPVAGFGAAVSGSIVNLSNSSSRQVTICSADLLVSASC